MSEAKSSGRTGYVGNLTSEQTTALQALKDDLPAATLATCDDFELLRFLRARKFVVADAKAMLVEYKEWYEKNKIAHVLDKLPPKSEIIVRLIPGAYHGFDKEGHPIHIERTGSINCEILMSQFTDREIYHCHVYGQEKQIRRCLESCTARGVPAGSIESFTTIMDLKGLGWGHRAALKFSKLITEADSKYYPERMHRTYIVNAPGLFSFFWAIASVWLDPVTKSKVVMVSDDLHELTDNIDADQLPKRYGGTADVALLEDPDVASLYAEFCKDPRPDSEYNKANVKAGDENMVQVPLTAGELHGWTFKSSDAIGFEAYFLDNSDDGKEQKIVNAYSKVTSDKIPNKGVFLCEFDGTLVLRWKNDNWFSSVDVLYVNYAVKDDVLAQGMSTANPAADAAAEAHVGAAALAAQVATETAAASGASFAHEDKKTPDGADAGPEAAAD